MKSLQYLLLMLLGLGGTWAHAQNDCSGTWTDAADGTVAFADGFTYAITYANNNVTVAVELLDPQVGLVAFAQTYNPNFAEVQMMNTGGQAFSQTFAGQTPGATFTVAVKFAFAGGFVTSTPIAYIIDEGCDSGPPPGEVELPITFEEAVNYGLVDFGGNASTIVVDPTDAGNMVVQSIKTVGAQVWAGTTVAEVIGFVEPLPFAPGATTMTVRVWSPLSGIQVRLKVENLTNTGISVETEATVTQASVWQTLTFDFDNEAAGTAALNFNSVYTKASIFFNFGVDGATSGEQTYYWDDVVFGDGGVEPPIDVIELPITFEEDIDYGIADFGGNASMIVVDPTDAGNMVVQSIKTVGAQTWAGTTVAEGIGFAEALPFAEGATTMTVRVWSPLAGIPVRLKVENLTNNAISVETEAMVTEASVWQTLTFDFANEATGTAAINFASVYTKASIFFNFGTDGATSGEQTYYWDDVTFGDGTVNPPAEPLELPITFEEDIDYGIVDFGGNASMIVVDPTDAGNMVVQSIKTAAAQTWAGTTVAEVIGFAEPLPFAEGETTMTVRVWSPLAGIPVRLKVENLTNNTISVETEAMVTQASVWQTLTFDFANEATGTAAINFASVYTKASIFFNFDTDGATSGEQTYYWDDVTFGSGASLTTVYDIIAGSPVHTTLKSLIDQAGLDDDLMSEGPFTVFAPTDEAFMAVPADVLASISDDPIALQAVLLYHVLGAEVLANTLFDGQTATTLQGEDIEVSIEGTSVLINTATVTDVDLMADNGVVHVINGVLLPPSFTVGTLNSAKEMGINVFPNPTTDYIQISFTETPSENTVLTLFDMNGKVVKQENFSGQDQRFAVSELPAGAYLLRFQQGEAHSFQKLMIAR